MALLAFAVAQEEVAQTEVTLMNDQEAQPELEMYEVLADASTCTSTSDCLISGTCCMTVTTSASGIADVTAQTC